METQEDACLGSCKVHGDVRVVRQLPRLQFPFVIYAVLRFLARRREPFRCPTCDDEVVVVQGKDRP